MNQGQAAVDTAITQFTNLTANCFRAFNNEIRKQHNNQNTKDSNVAFGGDSRRQALIDLLNQAKQSRLIVDKLLVTDKQGLGQHISNRKDLYNINGRSGHRTRDVNNRPNPWEFQRINAAKIEISCADADIELVAIGSRRKKNDSIAHQLGKREALSEGVAIAESKKYGQVRCVSIYTSGARMPLHVRYAYDEYVASRELALSRFFELPIGRSNVSEKTTTGSELYYQWRETLPLRDFIESVASTDQLHLVNWGLKNAFDGLVDIQFQCTLALSGPIQIGNISVAEQSQRLVFSDVPWSGPLVSSQTSDHVVLINNRESLLIRSYCNILRSAGFASMDRRIYTLRDCARGLAVPRGCEIVLDFSNGANSEQSWSIARMHCLTDSSLSHVHISSKCIRTNTTPTGALRLFARKAGHYNVSLIQDKCRGGLCGSESVSVDILVEQRANGPCGEDCALPAHIRTLEQLAEVVCEVYA